MMDRSNSSNHHHDDNGKDRRQARSPKRRRSPAVTNNLLFEVIDGLSVQRFNKRMELSLWVVCSLTIFQICMLSVVLRDMEPRPDFSPMLSTLKGVVPRFIMGGGGREINLTAQAIRRARRERIKNRWDPGRDGLKEPLPLKIGFPVFVASLSKSGTTSIWQYFNCGGHPSSHQWVKRDDDNTTEFAGQCMYKNIEAGQPPFQNCYGKKVFTDTSYAFFSHRGIIGNTPLCYYPSIYALDALYESYPDATVILVVRETESWYHSMATWGNGTLLNRVRRCNLPGFPREIHPFPDDVKKWYNWHNHHVRSFAKLHPKLRYIEVSLEDNATGAILEREIGIPATCWGKCTPTSKFCQRLHPPNETTT